MKRKIFLLILLLFPFLIIPNVPIKTAIANGIKINCEIRNNELESRILETDLKIRKLNRYFTINGSGNYLYRSEKISIKLPDMEIAPGMIIPGKEIGGGTNHIYDLSLSVFQPIFTGNALSGLVKMNNIRKSLNLSNRKFLELMLSGRIKSVFFNHQMLASQIRSLETLEKKITNHLDRLEDLYNEDLAGKSQVLETRLKQSEIELSKEEIQNSINILSSTFMELTGYRLNNIEKKYSEPIKDQKTLMKLFLLNHPKMMMLSDQKKIIRINKKITRGKDLPHIGGFAELHYGMPGINFLNNEWTSYFQGGLEVKINVFNWGLNRKENIINNYNIEKISNKEKDLVKKTRLRLAELFNTLKSLNVKIATFKKMISISEEESELKKTLFNEKQISNKDYLDSLLNVESLRSLRDKTSLQSELIKVEINTMIGNKEEK